MSLASVWLTVGLLVDGYAHEHLLSGGESFLTPWHALFYSGFAATTVVFGRLVHRRLDGGPLWDAVPTGHRIGIVGLGVFALGGVGDAWWHTRFGFEKGTEALYSPTHLLLFVGLIAIVSCPYRTLTQARHSIAPSWFEFAPAALSMVLALSIVAFFSPWAFYPNDWYRVTYDAATNAGDTEINAALGAELTTTLILVGGALFVLRHWRPPHGAFAVLFSSTTALFALAFGGTAIGVIAAFLSGVTMDVILAPTRTAIETWSTARIYAATGCAAAVLWLTLHLLLSATGDLEWSAPLAAGTPLLCTLAALGLTAIANPTTGAVSSPR